MSPFGFVNWRQMNAYFCLVMWLLVAALVVIIISHVAHTAPSSGHVAAQMIR